MHGSNCMKNRRTTTSNSTCISPKSRRDIWLSLYFSTDAGGAGSPRSYLGYMLVTLPFLIPVSVAQITLGYLAETPQNVGTQSISDLHFEPCHFMLVCHTLCPVQTMLTRPFWKSIASNSLILPTEIYSFCLACSSLLYASMAL